MGKFSELDDHSFLSSSLVQPVAFDHFVWTTRAAKLNYCSARLNQGREFANCFSFKCSAPYLNESSSVAERQIPKLYVMGSAPIAKPQAQRRPNIRWIRVSGISASETNWMT